MDHDNLTQTLDETLEQIAKARVCVFGDFCLDAYWDIDPDETERSVETGLPVRRIRDQRYSLGGAGNVVANLADLGVKQVFAVGAVGTDLFGYQLLYLLDSLGVDRDGIVCLSEWQTIVYAKPCVSNRELNRMDFGGFNEVDDTLCSQLLKQLETAVAASDVVILNQQVPCGVSSAAVIDGINQIIKSNPGTTFLVDSRDRPELYAGSGYKLNVREARKLCGSLNLLDHADAADADTLATAISCHSGQCAIVTRGEHGMVIAFGADVHSLPGIHIDGSIDPVGAGDTVISAFAAAIGGGASLPHAGQLANVAAQITVGKLKTTGTATPDEIRVIAGDIRFRDAELVVPVETQGHFEIIRKPSHQFDVRHVVFDHDGTISLLRTGWPAVMERVMVDAIVGETARVSDDELGAIHESVAAYLRETTGRQTIGQMVDLVEMIKEYGHVATSKIRPHTDYLEQCFDGFDAMVEARLDEINQGVRLVEDFQVPCVAEFIEALFDRGVKLSIASGTDEEAVAYEAAALGYGDWFEGRVFGSRGDVTLEPKKRALDYLQDDLKLTPSQIVVIGDGPVEMREAAGRGIFGIGVASDEELLVGIDQGKRERLIDAGANMIIGDYRDYDAIMAYLGIT